MVCSSIDTHLPDVLWVGLCRENHTLTEAGRLLRGQRGCGRSVDRCVTSLRVNILHRGVVLLIHLQLLVGMQVVFLNTLTEAGLLPRG